MRASLFLLTALAAPLLAQKYDALTQALGLSDEQMARIEATSNFPSRGVGGGRLYDPGTRRPPLIGEPAKVSVLDELQRATLGEIKIVLDRWSDATAAVGLGLIAGTDWPGTGLCVFDPVGSYASYSFARQLDLTETQIRELREIRRAGPRPELARSILNPVQRAKLAEFERSLQLAREAIDLGLIFRPGGEGLCY